MWVVFFCFFFLALPDAVWRSESPAPAAGHQQQCVTSAGLAVLNLILLQMCSNTWVCVCVFVYLCVSVCHCKSLSGRCTRDDPLQIRNQNQHVKGKKKTIWIRAPRLSRVHPLGGAGAQTRWWFTLLVCLVYGLSV